MFAADLEWRMPRNPRVFVSSGVDRRRNHAWRRWQQEIELEPAGLCDRPESPRLFCGDGEQGFSAASSLDNPAIRRAADSQIGRVARGASIVRVDLADTGDGEIDCIQARIRSPLVVIGAVNNPGLIARDWVWSRPGDRVRVGHGMFSGLRSSVAWAVDWHDRDTLPRIEGGITHGVGGNKRSSSSPPAFVTDLSRPASSAGTANRAFLPRRVWTIQQFEERLTPKSAAWRAARASSASTWQIPAMARLIAFRRAYGRHSS